MSNANFTNRREQAQAMSQILFGMMELSKHMKVTDQMMAEIKYAIDSHPEQNWMDALSKGQVASKMWLVKTLNLHMNGQLGNVYILGGWVALIPYLISNWGTEMSTGRIVSIDMDDSVNPAAESLNLKATMQGRFKATTGDAYELNYTDDFGFQPDLIINTMCEHLSEYQKWIDLVPVGTIVALQSNNMFGIDDHVNCKESLDEFVAECGLSEVFVAETLDLMDTWKRFMIVGRK